MRPESATRHDLLFNTLKMTDECQTRNARTDGSESRPYRDHVPTPTLILGVGNVLVGDEGVGVHAARLLAEEQWPAHVAVLDGGTGGFHLLEYFQSYPRLILVDATRDGSPAGTVCCFRAATPLDCPPALGAHDIGLRDLLAAAALLGHWPQLQVVTVAVEQLHPMELELSPAVAAALPAVRAKVRELVEAG